MNSSDDIPPVPSLRLGNCLSVDHQADRLSSGKLSFTTFVAVPVLTFLSVDVIPVISYKGDDESSRGVVQHARHTATPPTRTSTQATLSNGCTTLAVILICSTFQAVLRQFPKATQNSFILNSIYFIEVRG